MKDNLLSIAVIKSGLKVYEVANQAGLHPSTLSHLLNEHFPPTENHKIRIAKALNKRIEDLFPERKEVING